jgi:chromosome segregation ATPase
LPQIEDPFQKSLKSGIERQVLKKQQTDVSHDLPSDQQPKVLSTAHIFQQKQLQKRVEDLESEKQKLSEDYQRQLQQALRDRESQSQATSQMENDIHKLESERDKLNLKVQQGELQLAKLRQRITDLESEVSD